MPTPSSNKQLLLIGASRGLGFALAEEYVKRGWHVVATERNRTTSKLHDLLGSAKDRLEIETMDINYPDQVAALRARLASRKFDMLFVNAGIGIREMIADVSTDEFIRMMVTNALSPMRVVESLQDLVLPTGTIGIMSSGQGSITNNENGIHDDLPYKQGSAQHAHAQLRCPPRRRSTNSASHGAWLGANGPGRPSRPTEHRGEHTKPREYDGRAGWNSGSSVSGLHGPEGSVVSASPN